MAKADCVIRGGLVVSGKEITRADILVGDGVIQKVGEYPISISPYMPRSLPKMTSKRKSRSCSK